MNRSGYLEYRVLNVQGECLGTCSTFNEALIIGRSWRKNHPEAGWLVIDGLDSQGNRVPLHQEW